jgi:hypothetical protein
MSCSNGKSSSVTRIQPPSYAPLSSPSFNSGSLPLTPTALLVPTPLIPEEIQIDNDLSAKGCSPQERAIMLRIFNEVYSGGIGRIRNNPHYWYEDGSGRSFDNGQTNANCGLYAIKRMLHHLGQLNLVDKDLWQKYPDRELRYIIVERTGALRFSDGSSRNKLYISESEPLTSENLAYLMCWLGIPYEANNYSYELQQHRIDRFDHSPLPLDI